MSLPFIKFFTFTISYIGFVFMIISSSLQLQNEQKNRERFSKIYEEHVLNYSAYINNSELKYKFKTDDFFIRKNNPDYLDIAICIWLLGIQD